MIPISWQSPFSTLPATHARLPRSTSPRWSSWLHGNILNGPFWHPLKVRDFVPIRVGINGFGRIGRQVLKAVNEGGFSDLFEIAAVNDLTSPDTLAHLLKYDSTYGRYDAEIAVENGGIRVNDQTIKVFAEKDPAALPWQSEGVDLVVESTGRFTDAE